MGLVAFCLTAPVLLFAGAAGQLVDRWPKRSVLVGCDLLRALLVLLVPASQALGLGLPAALCIVVVLASLNVFFLPARAAVLPEIVPRERLVAANAATTSGAIAATVLGSALGGLVIEARGWRTGFYLDSLSYAVSVIAMWFVRPATVPAGAAERRAAPSAAGGLAAGWRAIRASADASVAVLLFVALYLAGATLFVLAPPGVAALSGRPTRDTGLLIALLAVGVIAGSALAARAGRGRASWALCAAGAATVGVALLGFAVAPSVVSLGALAVLAGLGAAPLLVSADAVLQLVVDPGVRARVFATRDVLSKSVFLGTALAAGAAATRLPSSALLLVEGVAFVAGGGALAWRRRAGLARGAGEESTAARPASGPT